MIDTENFLEQMASNITTLIEMNKMVLEKGAEICFQANPDARIEWHRKVAAWNDEGFFRKTGWIYSPDDEQVQSRTH